MNTKTENVTGRSQAVSLTRVARAGWTEIGASTLSGKLVDRIRSALMSGAIGSGEFLGTETALASQFGVSRTVVREALRMLEGFGVVDVRAGRSGGVWVASGNASLLVNALAIQLKLIGISQHEMLDMQAAIEVKSAELAAQRRNPDDLACLRGIIADLVQLENQPDRFTARSMDFHMAIVEASHNRGLVAQFAALRQLLLPAYSAHTNPRIARAAVKAHRALLDRIELADSGGARAQMAERLAQIRARGFLDTKAV